MSFLAVYESNTLINLGHLGNSLVWFCATTALVLYPDGALGRLDRIFVGYCLLILPGAEATLAALDRTYAEVRIILEPRDVSVIVFFVAISVRRWWQAGYLVRRSMPAARGGSGRGRRHGIRQRRALRSDPRALHRCPGDQQPGNPALLVPAALVHGTVRRRSDCVRAVEAFGELVATGASRAQVRDCLREVLRDDALDILFSDASTGVLVNGDGTSRTRGCLDRIKVPIADGDGQLVAVIETSAAVERHKELRRALTSAGGMYGADDPGARESPAPSGEEARLAEQDRIRRDLRPRSDRPVGGPHAAGFDQRASPGGLPELKHAIDDAHRGLVDAIGELTRCVEGIRPELLADHGLEPALSELAVRVRRDLPRLELRVTGGRFPGPVESVAFRVVNEGIAYVLKHSPQSALEVLITHAGNQLEVSVADDGQGGACMAPGRGLHALRDSCREVGGELVVTSSSRGTRLTATLPCVRTHPDRAPRPSWPISEVATALDAAGAADAEEPR